MKKKNKLILEFTEFNNMRLTSDTGNGALMGVDNPALSTDAFDKHQSGIRQALSRINDILGGLRGTSAYSKLRSDLGLEDQDITHMKVLRILKTNNVKYDVYVSFIISEKEYWGVIYNILGHEPEFKSEVFTDFDLYQPKEWVIKIKGLIIKTVKEWLKPERGTYRLINDEIICYSVDTGKMLSMEKGIEVELIRSHDDKIIIKHQSDYYNLVGDNHIYFNWWFEKIN